MLDLTRNNLDGALSPYLRQHADNPIHWQEWTSDVLDAARTQKKLILVSIGYATCHWCHVMAREAFSDQNIADILNTDFIAIKVDREQRPDIDQVMMEEVVRQTDSGGWPLNVILTPERNTLFCGTYLPVEDNPASGMPAFADVLRGAVSWYRTHGEQLPQEAVIAEEREQNRSGRSNVDELLATITQHFDREYGGFGVGTKFPPHATLLFLLLAEQPLRSEAQHMLQTTLETLQLRGLHDHLQGGFYRYCTDRAWTIPHFEKMLYDQAMLLLVYGLAGRILDSSTYGDVARSIIRCLDETFADGDLFVSAHDADTEHHEGATYLWTPEELRSALTKEEFTTMEKTYNLVQQVEGKIHLLRRNAEAIPAIESKLLAIRTKRAQPFTDRKIVTSWNALLGIAFLHYGRAQHDSDARTRARTIADALIARHVVEGRVLHSSLDGQTQTQSFLADHAALLLLLTFVYEEAWDPAIKEEIEDLAGSIHRFRDGDRWCENEEGSDLQRIAARSFDHPEPSTLTLVEWALLRAHRILDRDHTAPSSFEPALESDAYNLLVLLGAGKMHEIHAPEHLDPALLPPMGLLLPGTEYQDCFANTCRRFASKKDLLAALQTS